MQSCEDLSKDQDNLLYTTEVPKQHVCLNVMYKQPTAWDQCDITLSKAWSSSSKPFLKSMHYMPQSVGFTLWSELTLKASRIWASITLELLHNAKNKCIKQIWKGYFALSRDIIAKAALEPFICTILQCLWLRFS